MSRTYNSLCELFAMRNLSKCKGRPLYYSVCVNRAVHCNCSGRPSAAAAEEFLHGPRALLLLAIAVFTLKEGIIISVRSLKCSEGDVSDPLQYIHS